MNAFGFFQNFDGDRNVTFLTFHLVFSCDCYERQILNNIVCISTLSYIEDSKDIKIIPCKMEKLYGFIEVENEDTDQSDLAGESIDW